VKIKVTYEKKDILRLVHKDMQAQGIHVKSGTTLVYKGALQVTVQVETDEDEGPGPSTYDATITSAPLSADTSPEMLASVAAEEAVEMGSVLGASKHLVMTQPGKFEAKEPRTLTRNDMMQEFDEFPEDK
jgi:hypothetical protein